MLNILLNIFNNIAIEFIYQNTPIFPNIVITIIRSRKNLKGREKWYEGVADFTKNFSP